MQKKGRNSLEPLPFQSMGLNSSAAAVVISLMEEVKVVTSPVEKVESGA